MHSRKTIGAVILGLAVAFMISVATPAFSADPSPKQVWDQSKAAWNKVNSYACNLFVWNYKTPSFIRNFPEHRKPDDKPGWDYRLFSIRFKKPDQVLLTYLKSMNEDLVNGSMIDVGIAYVLTYIPGTTFNYGYKDKSTVYVIFPYISDRAFNALPVPPDKKASMKLLMVASRKEVYHKLPNDVKDRRGNILTETSIGLKMKQYEHYFTDGKVTFSKSKMPQESDFTLNKQTGWLTEKAPTGKQMYKLTMVPKDVKKNKGISKAEVFVDPSTSMFVGLKEYEGNKLVQVLLFPELKVNANIPDSDWATLFKGRKLSDKN